MYKFNIKLTTIKEVQEFVNAACKCMCEIDIISGKYITDAKSIMGIFGIDHSKPVTVSVNGTEEEYKAFRESVKDVVIED